MNFSVLSALLFLPFGFAGAAQTPAAPALIPLRVSSPPVIDGKLDDAVWQQAPFVTGFKTFSPDFGRDMSEPTRAFYAYDRENIYFAFEALDSHPELIKAAVSSRDSIRPDDWVCINLDTFGDSQALYAFYVNPLGIQGDSRYAGGQEDHGFDTVWYSAGRKTDSGYTVEIRIPLKSIRFSHADPVRMAIIFERRISRHSENGTYPPMKPERGMAFLTQMQPIVYEGVTHYTLWELLPAVTYSRRSARHEARLATLRNDLDFSLTAKYGITSDLIADATVNPDFSQVESDAGQIDINLRSPLYFPEKRPFFLEGAESFNVGGASQYDPLRTVVHTRSIVDPAVGGKLTGKLSARDTIAAIYAFDQASAGLEGSDAHFGILRYKRTLQDDSYLGGFLTARESAPGYNRVFGADGVLRTGSAATVSGYAFLSSSRYGNDPETHGRALSLGYDYGTRNLDLSFRGLDISTGFRADAGYLTRNGIGSFSAHFGPKFYPRRGPLRRLQPSVLVEPARDHFSRRWEAFNFAGLDLLLPRATSISARYESASEIYAGEKFDTSGVQVQARSQVTKQFRLEGRYRNGKGIFYAADPYQGLKEDASAAVTWQASENWESSLSLTYSDFRRPADAVRVYDYAIIRCRNTYQVNRYLFFRGIAEHNSFRKRWILDLLASFTYIPGTVVHLGYGSLFEKLRWENGGYVPADSYVEMERGLFFKASYLWRR